MALFAVLCAAFALAAVLLARLYDTPASFRSLTLVLRVERPGLPYRSRGVARVVRRGPSLPGATKSP